MKPEAFLLLGIVAPLVGCGTGLDPYAYVSYPLRVLAIDAPEHGKVGEAINLELQAMEPMSCSVAERAFAVVDEQTLEVDVRAEGKRSRDTVVCPLMASQFKLTTSFTPTKPGLYRIFSSSKTTKIKPLLIAID